MQERYYAVRTLLENNINEFPITTEHVKKALCNYGYNIIKYSTDCDAHVEILKNLGVLSLAGRTEAFTYKSEKEKIVFIKIGVSADNERLLLAHELGHIAMGHMSDSVVMAYTPWGLIDRGQEDEANAFALEFLAPVCVLKKLHITFRKIKDTVLLDDKFVKIISDRVSHCHALSNIEIMLCNRFKKKPKRNVYGKITDLLSVRIEPLLK